MRVALFVFALVAVAVALAWIVDLSGVADWAVTQQRALQNEMAGAIHGLRTGADGSPEALWAWLTLSGAAGAYGFVHALGPGHGKYLIGGVGLASKVNPWHLTGVALASSLAQALWAIVLVYGGFTLFALSAQRMTGLAEDVFAPASHLAIAAIGATLVWRGVRQSLSRVRTIHAHQDSCGCKGHGPAPEEVSGLTSLRETLVLIASIAIRPCTGAIFLLVIAWQLDIRAAGAAAVVVMGLGTAALTTLVAVSSVAGRNAALLSSGALGSVAAALPVLQLTVGLLIIWTSLFLLGWT